MELLERLALAMLEVVVVVELILVVYVSKYCHE